MCGQKPAKPPTCLCSSLYSGWRLTMRLVCTVYRFQRTFNGKRTSKRNLVSFENHTCSVGRSLGLTGQTASHGHSFLSRSLGHQLWQRKAREDTRGCSVSSPQSPESEANTQLWQNKEGNCPLRLVLTGAAQTSRPGHRCLVGMQAAMLRGCYSSQNVNMVK